jgi:hypothetical protein
MASLLGGGFTGEGGIPLDTTDSVSTRKIWVVSGLLSSGRVRSTNDEIRSITWVSFSKGRMGSTSGNGSTTWVTLSNGRVGMTEDGIRLTTLVSLYEGRAGLTKNGIGSTSLSNGSIKDVTILTT